MCYCSTFFLVVKSFLSISFWRQEEQNRPGPGGFVSVILSVLQVSPKHPAAARGCPLCPLCPWDRFGHPPVPSKASDLEKGSQASQTQATGTHQYSRCRSAHDTRRAKHSAQGSAPVPQKIFSSLSSCCLLTAIVSAANVILCMLSLEFSLIYSDNYVMICS